MPVKLGALLLLVISATPDGGVPRRTIADVKVLCFHASWCQSCKRLDEGKVLERLAEREPALKVEQVDVDTQVPLLDRYGVTQTPTLILVDADGFPLGRPAIDLDHPDLTLDRLHKLVKKMVKP
jgi:thiol-disulfide isomerase/thioredoxin